MNEKKDKIFCGSGKTYGQYGQIGITVFLDDIPGEHIFKKGDKKAVKLNVCAKKTPNEKSTHYVEVNTWKPDGNKPSGNNQPPQQTGQPPINIQPQEPMGTLDMKTNEEVPF